MQACDRCHARKTRCDRRIPQCSACEKAGAACLHADKLRQRNLPRNYIDSIETLVQQLREENNDLRRTLATSQREESGTLATLSASQHEEAGLRRQQAGSNSSPSPSASVTSPAVSSGGSVDDAFALEVGYLSLIATGETRYLGSSSGIGLATIISKVLSAQSGISLLSVSQPSNDGMGKVPRPSPAVSVDDVTFPSRAVAMPVIETYFQHTHVTFPLLHRPSFATTVERIYNEPGYYDSNPFEAFTFDMVLAIGASNFNRFGESAAGASVHYAAAQSKVSRMMEMDGLTTLRSILLISQHAIFSNLRDTSANVWHLVGIGARICIELGLHLEHKSLNSGPRGMPQGANSISSEEEMRRRCFWCLYNLDRVVSFTLGRPVVIRDEEIDVPLPSHLDDECFGPNQPIVMAAPTEAGSQKNTSPFLHLIRIRRLSGQILSLCYNSRNLANTSIRQKRQMRRKFYLELESWWDDTQHLCLPESRVERNYVSSFLSLEWYKAVYNNAILLLYRPSPYLPHPTMISDTEDGEPDLLRLLNAATGSIISYSELHQRRRLNYSWITLHGVFLGGLAYIYCVGRILRDPTLRRLVPDFLSIIETTRACSNVLVAICERWNASRRSCDLFNKLTNAILRDALNLSAKQDGSNSREPRTEHDSSSMATYGNPPELNQRQSQQQQSQQYDPSLGVDFMDPMPQLDDILVMDEFRQFAGSFGMEHQAEDGSFPSELVSGFSQDWPFDTPFTTNNDFDSSMHGMGSNW
ncbi:c6 zinc finger domain-containing protein [Xylariales sp. AK1849]|nr:c6 zinc finger domain-containing protein [Xylariales sp. AK1849]